MNIHIRKQKQGSSRLNLAREVYRNKSLNEKYDIDYYSSDTHIIIKNKEGCKRHDYEKMSKYEEMSKTELILRLVEKDNKIKYYREEREKMKGLLK